MPSAPQPAWSGRGQQQAQYRHKAITLGVTLDRLQQAVRIDERLGRWRYETTQPPANWRVREGLSPPLAPAFERGPADAR